MRRDQAHCPLMKSHRAIPGTRKLGHSEFPDVEVVGLAGAEVTGDTETCRGLPRKLTESAREFPKAFCLAGPVRVAPGGAGAPASPTTSAFHCLVPSVCRSLPRRRSNLSQHRIVSFHVNHIPSFYRSLCRDATLGYTSAYDKKHVHFRWGTWLA